jgi:hypothetical protein
MQRHILSIRNGGHKLFEDYRDDVYTAARVEGMGLVSSSPALTVAYLTVAFALFVALCS